MAEDKVDAAVQSAKKGKAKVKKLEQEPENTKFRKLQKEVLEAVKKEFPKVKLNDVRLHTGGNAKELAKAMGARTFAVGSDIYFANPGDANDKALVAHEITHIINQGNGRVPPAKPGKALTGK